MQRLGLLTLALAGSLTACATVTAPAPPPASVRLYRALGTEPFWGLTLDGRQMVFTEANAPGRRIIALQPRPIIGIAGEIYQSPRISVNIVHARCSDGMSDRVYPDKVQVRVDGRAFEGCGGEAVASDVSVAGTSWTVVAVNGRPTGGGPRFTLAFTGERLSGQFGCNRVSGGYRADGERLLTTGLIMTRMACPEMSFENQAARILGQPVALRYTRDMDLELYNTAGVIRLREQH